MADTKGDRLQVSLVAYDEGGCTEVFWARSNDILAGYAHEGSFLLYPDGSATFKCWSGTYNPDEGEHETPFVLHIIGNRIVVAATEDINDPPDPDTIVFDSAKYAKEHS